MRKYGILLILFCGCNITLQAQRSVWSNSRQVKEGLLEVGVFTGLANYIGDLTPNTYAFKEFHPAAAAVARYSYSRFWGVKAGLMYCTISGSDANSGNPNRLPRNLSFRSRVVELSVMGEVNLFGFQPIEQHKISPYGFFGITVYHFNPKALYKDQWIALQPLGTEGEGIPGYGKKYNLTQISLPFGGGLKYGFRLSDGNYISISGELGLRKTFTDYLDDVSGKYAPQATLKKYNGDLAAKLAIRADEYYKLPVGTLDENWDVTRGSPKAKDWYFISGITICYIFYDKRYKYNFTPSKR